MIVSLFAISGTKLNILQKDTDTFSFSLVLQGWIAQSLI